MSVFTMVSWCAGIFGYLLDTVSELAYQCSPSAREFTTSGQEMVSRLSRQPVDWHKYNAYPGSKQASDEAPGSLPAFLALSIHISCIPLLLVLLVYHEKKSSLSKQRFVFCFSNTRSLSAAII
jgi:hypothetical protein